MICIIPTPDPGAAQVAELRGLCALDINTIRDAAATRTSIRDIEVFGEHWEDERRFLAALWRVYSRGNAAFEVQEQRPDGSFDIVSPEDLASRLEHYREIELEQQMLSDLECGHIDQPEAFEPHDDDWFERTGHDPA